MNVIASLQLILALSVTSTSSSYSFNTQVTTIAAENLKTATYYDSNSQKLTIVCDVASRGRCRFTVVDGSRRKIFDLRSKTRSVISGVSNKARVCAVGNNTGPCNLVAVTG